MRIVIDLQGKQSTGSKNRGIGRYSLSISQAIARNRKDHEVIIVLSSAFPEEISVIRNEFKYLLPAENIVVWEGGNDSSYLTGTNELRKSAEISRELFFLDLEPDVIYITSLFEGLDDNVTTSVGNIISDVPVAVTLYDLIPLINENPYLENPEVKRWYFDKVEHLKRADLLLAISQSSRQEALEHLDSSVDGVVNIGTAADPQFKRVEFNEDFKSKLLTNYNIKKDFLMYTGGIDLRKNIEGLIRSYAKLPLELRNKYQLAIVCSINESQKHDLELLINKVGLEINDVVLTGFISESELIALYNLCNLFIFPSWHEGFGLPVLEAMHCGAPVIAANTSSLPEVVGLEEALFDPYDDLDMANKIELVLTDKQFREKLCEHSLKQCLTFSWDHSAQKAITALEKIAIKSKKEVIYPKRLKLAYVSPLPPQRSGIADYSAELLTQLYRYYDIDVVVDQDTVLDPWITKYCNIINVIEFKENSINYERVLYHFGNSEFHQYMFNLLIDIPGVVVLHDFYLSGAINYMDAHDYENYSFADELFYSHGNEPFDNDDCDLVMDYPCNKKVLDYAKSVIVHSENSINLAKEWYGKTSTHNWQVIPLLRNAAIINNRDIIREKLNIPNDAIVVASFGIMSQSKCNIELVKAWLSSSLSENENCYLIFVGGNDRGSYGEEIQALIDSSGYSKRVLITGWTDTEAFKEYLSIADIGVQLRTLSRGETSAAVLDCMNYGLATIVNANGSMSELSKDAVLMLNDEFTQSDLVNALESLYLDETKRKILSDNAISVINKTHSPERCANQYTKAIESSYAKSTKHKEGLVELKSKLSDANAETHKWWLKATELDSEITTLEAKAHEWWVKATVAEEKSNAIINSKSWRLMRPLRFLSQKYQIIKFGCKAWRKFAPGSRPRRVLKKSLLVIKSYIISKPYLLKVSLNTLNYFPRLKNRLKSIAISDLRKNQAAVVELSDRGNEVYQNIKLKRLKKRKVQQ
ncbi:glycosyltransferase [Vibrio sp. 10N.222.52.C12]|uniref:glycosyltransferase n=1 Tax=Vibrio sp. 10N.222.52.C12 TaxID=3229630 RepID=UPI0035526449